jgi:hypothetical protein
MNARTQAASKVNLRLVLLAECAGRRDLMATLDRMYSIVVTEANATSVAADYRKIAAALGPPKDESLRTALAVMELRHKADELDDEPDDDEEERSACRCNCSRCQDGNHERCLRTDECGFGNSADYLERNPEEMLADDEDPADTDARNMAQLNELGRRIMEDGEGK